MKTNQFKTFYDETVKNIQCIKSQQEYTSFKNSVWQDEKCA